MRKLTLLFALLCVSVMGWATQYCGRVVTTTIDYTSLDVTVTVKKQDANTVRVILDNEHITGIRAGGTFQQWGNGVWANQDDAVANFAQGWTQDGNAWYKDFVFSTYPTTGNFQIYILMDHNAGLPAVAGFTLANIDIDNDCSGGGDPDPEPTPSVSPYCSTEIGHLADPNAAAGSFILLSVGSDGNGHTIVNIKQDAAKNTAMFDYINVVGKKETGLDVVTGGSDEMAIMFNTPAPDGDGNITFTLQWSTINWGGRWQINDITVPANATCENADPFPGIHSYCKYTDNNLRASNANVTLTWDTNDAGDVVITLGDGEGASNTHFRNEGFEYGGGKTMDDSWFVYSGTKHSVVETASTYFTAEVAVNGGNTYALRKKNGVTIPDNAVIAFFGHAFSWKNDQNNNAYAENKWFGYTYGFNCPFLAAPTNVAVDGTNHITFDAVANAQTYTAYVYLNGIVKHRQVVNSGDELTFQPYTTGTYQVEVVADAAGYPTSDPSDAYDWALTVPAIVVGNSEYCEWTLPKHNNQEANLTWETGDDGAITITLSPLSEQTAVFRAEGMKLSDFTVGAARTAASAYFNRSYTAGGTTVVLTLKDANIAPGLGEKIYFSGYIECKVQDQDTWPNPSLEYTYGSKCSGQKHVTVSVNNNEMGSATVDGVAAKDVDEGTLVTCVAVPASGYEFVNWTKGGVEVSTDLTYTPTINTATDLVANFDYVRTTYCHQAVTTNGGKKLYLTVGKGATEGTYQIKIYGSDELTITGINNANTAVNHIKYLTYDGNDVPLTIANEGWSFEAIGYGVISSAEIRPQTNHTWRDIWMWRPDLYIGTSAGEQNINAVLNQQNHFNWNSACSDAVAPVINKAEAEVLSESSVRLKIQATDNWGGLLTYTIAREAAEPIISNHASGEEFTQDVEGLTAGTQYTFTVTVSDGVNNANQNIVVTPVGDSEKPVMGDASLASKTWNSAIINVAATDNKGVTAYYIAELAAEYVATEGKITIEGLTAATDYTFHIKAKDAAGNISDNQAEVSFTTDAHSLVPTTAALVPTWPANQVKSIYSDSYSLAPAYIESYIACWWDCPTMTEEAISENHYLHYDLYRNGMIGAQFAETSMSLMEKIHIDIWASAAGSVTFRPITVGGPNTPKTLNLAAQQWNSFDIDLSEFVGHDWSKVFQFAIEGYQDGGLVGEHISVDNIFFYRTTPPPADETAPTDVIANKTEENFASVKLSAQANDDSGVVHFRVQNGSDVLVADVEAVSGAEVAITINNLTPNTDYTLSVVAFDEAGHEAEPVNVAVKTQALPSAAPQPTHVAEAVLSVYSNAYDPAVAATFNRANWGSAPVELESDYILYSMSANVIVWGNNDGNPNHGNIDALSGKTHGETPGLDVSGMTYIHFDVWCEVAGQLNTVNINDQAVSIPTTRTIAGEWVSFDVDITGVALADRQNVRWLKFHPFTNCFAAIDNVYFWKEPEMVRDDNWMAPGELGTICIPQGAIATGGDIYELLGKDENGKIVFATRPNNEMTPGKPYLFEAKSNAMRFYYTSATPASEPDNSGAMKGTFDEVTLTGDQLNNVYYFAGHALWSCVDLTSSGLHVSANRAWVVIDESMPPVNTSAPMPGRRIMTMNVNGKNTPTGIDQINSSDSVRKVLINGTMYILRGEKLYDATGRLVK